MQEFEAILFDFDGVLLDSEPVHFACWAEVLRPMGIDLDWPTYSSQCIGVSDRAMLEKLAAHCTPPAEVEELWARYPRKKELFRARMAQAPPFLPGIARFIRSLKLDFKLAVVTSSGRIEVEPLLKASGILPYLDAVIYGEDVDHHKPAPDPYLAAAARMRISRALVVEDSDAGMQSARAAGFEALRIFDPSRTVELVSGRLRQMPTEGA